MSILSQQKYQRQRMVKYAQKHSVTETAIRYRVSRKTVYKWISRYTGTLASLEDRSHRPKTSPGSHTEQELSPNPAPTEKIQMDRFCFWHIRI